MSIPSRTFNPHSLQVIGADMPTKKARADRRRVGRRPDKGGRGCGRGRSFLLLWRRLWEWFLFGHAEVWLKEGVGSGSAWVSERGSAKQERHESLPHRHHQTSLQAVTNQRHKPKGSAVGVASGVAPGARLPICGCVGYVPFFCSIPFNFLDLEFFPPSSFFTRAPAPSAGSLVVSVRHLSLPMWPASQSVHGEEVLVIRGKGGEKGKREKEKIEKKRKREKGKREKGPIFPSTRTHTPSVA